MSQGRSGPACWVYSVSAVIEEQRTAPEQLLLDFPTDDVAEVLNLRAKKVYKGGYSKDGTL